MYETESRGSVPDKVIGFLNGPNLSSRTVTLGSAQTLTEMSTRNLPGGKGLLACKADDLTATCESTIYKMCEPRRLTTLWDSTGCNRDSFTLLLLYKLSYLYFVGFFLLVLTL
jgi:hypothetical protein